LGYPPDRENEMPDFYAVLAVRQQRVDLEKKQKQSGQGYQQQTKKNQS
jgi:hypothetical protein